MRRLLAFPLVLLVAAALAFALTGAADDEGGKRSYRIVFDNAFGLVTGGDFRVGGVRAGSTSGFDVRTSRTGPPKAVVTAEVTEDGIPAFKADATCAVKPQSLIGEYFVDCQPGTARRRLAEGAAIPVTQTEGTIPIDLIQNVLRRPYRERLRVLVAGLGTGLAGRSERPAGGAAPRPSRPARDIEGAADPRRRAAHDPPVHRRRRHRVRRAGRGPRRRAAVRGRGRRPGRDRGLAPRRPARVGAAHAGVPGRAAALAGSPGRAGGRVRAAAGRPPGRGARPGERAGPPGPVRRDRAARSARAGQGRGAGHPGAA